MRALCARIRYAFGIPKKANRRELMLEPDDCPRLCRSMRAVVSLKSFGWEFRSERDSSRYHYSVVVCGYMRYGDLETRAESSSDAIVDRETPKYDAGQQI